MSRRELRKRVLSDNGLGKRIKWARIKVNIGTRALQKELGIPECNIRSIENGGRTTIYEDLYLLANFFNRELKRLYRIPQTYDGKPVEEVTISWLLFGIDRDRKNLIDEIDLMQEGFRRREIELIERNFDLDKQLMELRQGNSEKQHLQDMIDKYDK